MYFTGHLKGIPNDAAHQLHAEVRNAFGAYVSHIIDGHSNYHYALIMVYVSCILTCGYIFSSLWSSIAFCNETDGGGNGVHMKVYLYLVKQLQNIAV